MRRRAKALFAAASIALAAAAHAIAPVDAAAQPAPTAEARVDAAFAKWTRATPGCAVGMAENGTMAVAKGYGMADLEHDVPITSDSIFEAGSVSKQFTAAAVLLLAREGKLRLDDPVRKYVPELPEYGSPLLIRHMLNHTSGLRDWGSVAGIGGWPRTTRVYTHAHVLDIAARQKALNFTPGTRWSYSNTGFNLAAIIVARVSGVPFADFTRDRIFRPLGMAHTSWRDDYTRIVKGRAIAYDQKDGVYHMDMPFENVHGNGGLLTTVGDLLRWNGNFTHPIVGDPAFVAEQQEPGRFTDGRAHGYALGLYVGAFHGTKEVYHSGTTAGYSAFLTRLPDMNVSAAVLCNVATDATQLAHAALEAFLFGRLKPAAPIDAFRLDAAHVKRLAGLYRNRQTGRPVTIAPGGEFGLRIEGGAPLVPIDLRTLTTPAGERWTFDDDGGADSVDRFGRADRYERVPPAAPTASDLQSYAGTYTSDEAEVELAAAVDGNRLVLKRRPATVIALTPVYADAFRAGSLGLVIFRRDAAGAVNGLSVVQERVWDLRFAKAAATGRTQ